MSKIAEGTEVVVIPHASWMADIARLANSQRVGVVDRLFKPTGSKDVLARVVFPKRGNARERTEIFYPQDLSVAP